ncbi:MAG: acetylornithine deacetylase [Pseudomonadota bacterium]
MSDLAPQIEWIARLCRHDTTSRNSNLNLIEDVEGYLAEHGVTSTRVSNEDGSKANLYFTVGPMVEGGVVLSGHTDVVPVDGQPWDTDPWQVIEKDNKLYGRGTADMKSFSAIGLSLLPDMLAAGLKRPIHFALSYDEEVGLLGAPAMIEEIRDRVPAPAAVIVGEPTDMQVVDGQKGIAVFRTEITGHEAHSSQPHRGASAIMAAGRLMAKIHEMVERRRLSADESSPFMPPYTTMSVGVIEGGTAANILARRCGFTWDVRTVPGDNVEDILAEYNEEAARVEADMRAIAPECEITTETLADGPPLMPDPNNPAAELAHALTGANGRQSVSYAAEAGQFQQAGFSTVICGPGSIDQAHQPNEFIKLSQVAEGTRFMRGLIRHLSE